MTEKATNDWVTDRPPAKAEVGDIDYALTTQRNGKVVMWLGSTVRNHWLEGDKIDPIAWRLVPSPYVPPEPDTSLAASVGVVERYVNDEDTSLDFNKQVAPAIRAIIAAARRWDAAMQFVATTTVSAGRSAG